MSNVIEFPTWRVREWEPLRATMESVLAEAGAPMEMRDEVVSRMHQFWLEFNRRWDVTVSVPLPAEMSASLRQGVTDAISEGFEDFASKVSGLMSEIILERLELEVELYRWRQGRE